MRRLSILIGEHEMTPQSVHPRRRSPGAVLRILGRLLARLKPAKRHLPPPVDIPDYLRHDVGLLPQARPPRSVDPPPRINIFNL
ncbi:hypothetical protein D9R08_15630 [Rhodophyticola porphyridii]|uniref:Uncharacterized protein n=2 Tax=Rhodophyticola porphyridii TaxID=1852017 RepID=A0A3L9XXM0_9RHOB|nr:hypothetical protein D9R08_15630 [Rhodophyticola porphyridii]